MIRKFLAKVFPPNRAKLMTKIDNYLAAVSLKNYEHCLKNGLAVASEEDYDKFVDEFYEMRPKQIEQFIEKAINKQVVEMFESIHNNTEHTFSVVVNDSTIPDAGKGLFVKSRKEILQGTVLALYPGRVFTKTEGNDPDIQRTLMPDPDFQLMLRHDGVVIDPRNCSETIPQNPYGVGQFINHCGRDRAPNAYQVAFNFPEDVLHKYEFPVRLRKYIPNAYAFPPKVIDKMMNVGCCMRGVVFVASRPIVPGQELLMDYRFGSKFPHPAWYQPALDSANIAQHKSDLENVLEGPSKKEWFQR